MDPGESFWTEEEIAEEVRLYGKDETNENLEKLFQVRCKIELAKRDRISRAFFRAHHIDVSQQCSNTLQ